MLRWALLALLPISGSPAQEAEAGPKEGVVALFNGKDFAGLTRWLKDTRGEDPRKVFTVHDGMIHASGDGMGYVATEKAYRDYRLVVEYKWGSRTDGGKSVRNSGVLLHAAAADGGAGAWAPSIECQLAQGCAGDLIPIGGVSFTGDAAPGPDKRPRWKKGGAPTVFTKKQFWWSEHDPDFKELLDTRGRFDVESPAGEWTRVEIVCEGSRIRVAVNDRVVNEVSAATPASGRILLQCEGFEVFFRKFELHPLRKAEEKKP
jgi:hypothetical protein